MKKELLLVCLCVVGLVSGCSSGGGAPAIAVSVTSSTTTLQAGGTAQVTATVTNDSANKGVNWSVTCSVAACGSVSPTSTASGAPTTYTAPGPPASDLMVTITATSVADSSKLGTTTITIKAIVVGVAPATATVLAGNTQQFTATVMNTSNVAVTWTVTCSAAQCGTLSSTTTNPVTYTAPGPPSSTLTVTIKATSVADNTKSSSATITVPAITVSVAPPTANVPVKGTQPFTATVSNDASSSGVTWTLTQGGTACSPGCGTIAPAATLSGSPTTYTAPASVPANPTVTITATSVADPTKSGPATATILAIAISVSPTSASVVVNAAQRFIATVTNDVTSGGVAWTLTQAGTPCSPTCGTITPASTASGTPTTYTAPASVPAPATVTLTATSVADPTKSAPATITVTVAPPIGVSISPTNPTVTTNGTQQFTATVTNDPANNGVTWTLTQSGTPCSPACGTVAPASTASGAPTTYTAPASVPTPATVTITATSVSDVSKSASTTITVSSIPACGTGSETTLNGRYAFLLQGFDANGPVAIAGSFHADGTGGILGGEEDVNRTSGVTNTSVTLAGSSYSVGSDNRGCLTLVTGGTTSTYRFSLSSFSGSPSVAAKGHAVSFDTTGTNVVGVFEKQDPTAFSTAQITGDYAFGASSAKASGGRFGVAGRFTAAAGVLSAGAADADDSGTVNANLAFTGTYSVAATGRGTVTLNIVGVPNPVDGVFYVVSSGELLLMSSDSQASNSLFAGTILRQSGGPFANSALNAAAVISTEGRGSGAGTSDVQVGILTPDGVSAFTLSSDENNAGAVTQNSLSGTYSVASNGRVTITAGTKPPVVYLVSANKGFLVGTDSSVTAGSFEPQSAGPFNNASLSGNYAFGDVAPVVSGSTLSTGVITATSSTTQIAGTSDNNSSGSLSVQSFTATYSVASSGRVTTTSGTDTNVLYLVSSSKAVLISTKTTNTNSGIKVVDK